MIKIKKIHKCHLNKLVELWKNSDNIDLNDYDDSINRLKYFLKRNKEYCFAAFDNKELLGGALAAEDGKRGTIYHLFILKNYRNQGIAAKIIEKICFQMKQNGIYKINVTAFKNSKLSCSFWKHMGFKERIELSMFSLELLK